MVFNLSDYYQKTKQKKKNVTKSNKSNNQDVTKSNTYRIITHKCNNRIVTIETDNKNKIQCKYCGRLL